MTPFIAVAVIIGMVSVISLIGLIAVEMLTDFRYEDITERAMVICIVAGVVSFSVAISTHIISAL